MELGKQEIIDLRFVFKRPFFTTLSLEQQLYGDRGVATYRSPPEIRDICWEAK
jgi:hypothetical protein